MSSQSPKKGSALVTAIIIFLVVLVVLYIIGAAQGQNKERVSRLKENAAASVSSRGRGAVELDFGPRLFTAFDDVYRLLEDFDKKTGFDVRNIKDSEVGWADKEGAPVKTYKAKETLIVFPDGFEAEAELDGYFAGIGLEKGEASYLYAPKNKETAIVANYSKPNAFCFVQADLIAKSGVLVCGITD